MSLKLNAFAQVITQPMNVHKFIVDIPEAEVAALVVASTTFPAEKLRTISLYYQGEEIQYPTTPSNDHRWRIRVPESDSGLIRRQLDALKTKFWNQKTGLLTPTPWKNVMVTARDLQERIVFQTILHGAYLLGRESVDLANNDPTKNWEWNYEFCYTWIEDVDGDNDGSVVQLI